MGHGSNGSTHLGGSRGSRISTRDPLTHCSLHCTQRYPTWFSGSWKTSNGNQNCYFDCPL